MRWASVKGKVESMEGSSPKAERKFSSQDVVKFLIQNKAAVLLLILCVVLSFVSPYFLTAKNLINVVRQASVLAIMGIGFTLLLSSGSMDLSVGDLMAMTGVVIAILDAKIGVHPVLCMLAGVLVSVTGLCLNTFLVQTFKLPGFILTLATGMVYQGILWLISGGQSISGISDTLKFIGQGEIFRIPVQIYLLAVILIFMTVLLRRTEFGRHSLAMGGNLDSARVCGINITRNKYIIAVIMGACTAVAAMVTTGRAASAQLTAGSGTAMDTIAAVVIGGTPMEGGIANVPGTLVGCLLIQVISNGLNLLDVNSNWHKVAKGVIIVVAIILDVQGTKILNRFRMKSKAE